MNHKKIAFVGAVPFNLIFGGGETQLLNTMAWLKKSGVDVGFYDYWAKDFQYDIVHVFGCHYWNYQLVNLAKSRGAKIALSPISYNPRPALSYKLWKYLDPFVPLDTTYRLSRKLIDIADILLPNSAVEGAYLRDFLEAKESKIRVIPNAADTRFASASSRLFEEKYKIKDFVLCVGKIEPRKNQLNLAKAMAGTDLELVVIGESIPNRRDYFEKFKDQIRGNSNFMHIDFLPYNSDLLASAYAACRVHVLLGTNETPGIVNLEAGLAKANLVAADCSPVREYLADFIEYCDPDSLQSIRAAVVRACRKPKNDSLQKLILKNYTWEIAAKKTLESYEELF